MFIAQFRLFLCQASTGFIMLESSNLILILPLVNTMSLIRALVTGRISLFLLV